MIATRRILAGLAAVALAASASGCGDNESPGATSTSSHSTTVTTTETRSPPSADGASAGGQGGSGGEAPPDGKPSGPAESGNGDPRVTALEREAGAAVRRYIAALDDRDGDAVCGLLEPGAIDQVELPEPRGDCAASLEASIGYRDPRGLPVWAGAKATDLRSVEIDGETAKVVVTTRTRFADRGEISTEDDIVYLSRDESSSDGWLIAKPSSTLYRAVGIAEVPPSVFAAP